MKDFHNHGDTVILRYSSPRVAREFDRIQVARLLDDSESRTVLFVLAGSEYLHPNPSPDPRAPFLRSTYENRIWRNWSVVRHMFPGERYSIWAMYRSEDGGFARWYVNIEAPFSRTRSGFETTDHELDIVIESDRTWAWKDEDHLANMVAAGTFTTDEAVAFRQHGLDAIARLQQNDVPFSEPWPNWQPPEDWEPLEMPEWDPRWLE